MIAVFTVILWFSQRRSRQKSRDGALLCVRTVHLVIWAVLAAMSRLELLFVQRDLKGTS